MKIRFLAPFLAAMLLFTACSSGTTTTTSTTEPTTTEDFETYDGTLPVEDGSITGAQVPYTIKYDTSKWTVVPSDSTSDAEYEFEHVDGDVYALIIPERIELDLAALKEIALENAQSVAPDALVTFEEDRTVNGVQVHVMKIDGTLYGIAFEYYGYYYGGTAGTIQFITYTSSNLVSEYEADLTELLNGLTITE